MTATAQYSLPERRAVPIIIRTERPDPPSRRLCDRMREAEGRDDLITLLDELSRRLRSRTSEPFPRLEQPGTRHHAEAYYRAIQLQRLHDDYHLLLDRARRLRAQAETADKDALSRIQDEAVLLARRFREQETLEASLVLHRWVGQPESEAR